MSDFEERKRTIEEQEDFARKFVDSLSSEQRLLLALILIGLVKEKVPQ